MCFWVFSDLTGRTADCLVVCWVGGEISCLLSWVRLDGLDSRLIGRLLFGGEICWVSRARHDGTDGRLFGRKLGGMRLRAG
jgi:hypothetical protein